MPERLAVAVVAAAFAATLLLATTPAGSSQERVRNCAICHGKPSYKHLIKSDGQVADLYVDDSLIAGSVHHASQCSDCHADILVLPHDNYDPAPVDCTRCHFLGNPVGAPQSEAYQSYAESVHGQAVEAGTPNAPRCQDCHGSHQIRKPGAPGSPVSRERIGETCGRCHGVAFEEYRRSVHGASLYDRRSEQAPSCTDCHGEHDIFGKDDERSRTSHTGISDSCGLCHEALEISGQYELETKRLETFEDSFHGLALRFGSKRAANCASCHGHHEVLPSSDPRSSVHVGNIPKTCGQEGCHPGAGTNYAIGKVHVDPHDQEAGLVYYISTFFTYFTAAVILALVLHIILDLIRRALNSGATGGKPEEEG